MNEIEPWSALARCTPLGILTDLDGTLIPFAMTPEEAKPGPEILRLLQDLAALPGVKVAVVSGRPKDTLAPMLADAKGVYLVAEHGAWVRATGAWQPLAEGVPGSLDPVCRDFEEIARRYPGALVERKSWSVTLHHRRVRESEREELRIETQVRIQPWLASHPEFERLEGVQVVEVRPTRLRKSLAVPWMRDLCGPGSRLLALGDDLTDEDMFRSLGVSDESILVERERRRGTAANWRLRDPEAVYAFLRWILLARREGPTPPPPVVPLPILRPRRDPTRTESRFDLLCISNRLPHLRSTAANPTDRKQSVGGLVSAVEPALARRRGIWLGWGGNLFNGEEPGFVMMDEDGPSALAWMDLPRTWHQKYYNGLCNRALWPLFHSFPGHVHFVQDEWDCYKKVNEAFAGAALDLVGPETAVWVHDYHLLLVARALRRNGHRGPVGLFLHIPFPGSDMFSILPWAEPLLDGMLDFDLLGFHTPDHVDNFRQCVGRLSPAKVGDDLVLHRDRRIRVGAFPIGIIPEDFKGSRDATAVEEITSVLGPLSRGQLILGVDRLDYTKGIPERLLAFGRMLELFPEWRGKASFLQVSVPSREDVPEYSDQRTRVENIVGRINGEYGEANWVPIRYLYRSYGRAELSELYRKADVACVTPLRDGMNLVAKEYVAAQNPDRPGVLVLSSFAGAARELRDAVLTNPWHVDGLARDLDRALRMSPDERQARHQKLLAAVSRTTAVTWADDFISTLEGCRRL